MNIIKGLKKWEVMKAVEEGKPWAASGLEDDVWIRMHGSMKAMGACLAQGHDIAIIDEPKEPVIEWDEFDWGFFTQYGGLQMRYSGSRPEGYASTRRDAPIAADARKWELRESPLYPWTGGECPVPGNVEVEVVRRIDQSFRDEMFYIGEASKFPWNHVGGSCAWDVIAFRITGKVY
jgi:hypothetical protein